MRLEGTLDAFSLPDIFQLLSFTKKTGTLHLRRAEAHGVVHVREGAVTGARADAGRQALGRRVVGAGLVDDDALEAQAAQLPDGAGLARALVDAGVLARETVLPHAVEQATDAVFDLLRWPDGEFAFVMDEADPDDVGAALPLEDAVAEGRRRLEVWPQLAAVVPSPDAVLAVVPPAAEITLSADEWHLLSLVDGRRTVADLASLLGRGEYGVVSAVAALVERGLVRVGEAAGEDPQLRRQAVLARLEGASAPAAPPVPTAPAPATPIEALADAVSTRPVAPAQADRSPVIPDRPQPFTPVRRPEHPEAMPTYAATPSVPVPQPAAPVMASSPTPPVHGSAAMQPDVAQAPQSGSSSFIERDPSVNKSLLLRLIAGVRGL